MHTAVRRVAWAEWAGWTCKEPEGFCSSDVLRLVDRKPPAGNCRGFFRLEPCLVRRFASCPGYAVFCLRYCRDMCGTESALDETSLRRRLKRETTAAHQHLEAQFGLLDPSLDLQRYRRVLETFYGFYIPVEIDVTRLASMESPLGFPLRARAELIQCDLLALGRSSAELAALPLCSDRPELSCFEDLAGCLYVLEGACLGGQVLIPLLRRRLGLAKRSGAAFFAGDEERTLPRWTAVIAWLDGLPRTGASTAKIISAAQATFSAFARWAAVARGGSP
jgi:heme oxygenase